MEQEMSGIIISQAHASSVMGGDFTVMSFLPFVLIIAIMYFLIIRPQSKRAKEHKEMIEAIKRGDKVVTAGGFIGSVSKVVDQNELMVELSPGIEVRTLRSSISQVLSKTGSLAPEKVSSDKGSKKDSLQSNVKKIMQKQTGKKSSSKR
jgi:preprotein translocase subunit YajC